MTRRPDDGNVGKGVMYKKTGKVDWDQVMKDLQGQTKHFLFNHKRNKESLQLIE